MGLLPRPSHFILNTAYQQLSTLRFKSHSQPARRIPAGSDHHCGVELERSDFQGEINGRVDTDSDDREGHAKKNDLIRGRSIRSSFHDLVKASQQPAENQKRPRETADPAPFNQRLQVIFMRIAPDAFDLVAQMIRVMRKNFFKSAGAEAENTGLRNNFHAGLRDKQTRIIPSKLIEKLKPAGAQRATGQKGGNRKNNSEADGERNDAMAFHEIPDGSAAEVGKTPGRQANQHQHDHHRSLGDIHESGDHAERCHRNPKSPRSRCVLLSERIDHRADQKRQDQVQISAGVSMVSVSRKKRLTDRLSLGTPENHFGSSEFLQKSQQNDADACQRNGMKHSGSPFHVFEQIGGYQNDAQKSAIPKHRGENHVHIHRAGQKRNSRTIHLKHLCFGMENVFPMEGHQPALEQQPSDTQQHDRRENRFAASQQKSDQPEKKRASHQDVQTGDGFRSGATVSPGRVNDRKDQKPTSRSTKFPFNISHSGFQVRRKYRERVDCPSFAASMP